MALIGMKCVMNKYITVIIRTCFFACINTIYVYVCVRVCECVF